MSAFKTVPNGVDKNVLTPIAACPRPNHKPGRRWAKTQHVRRTGSGRQPRDRAGAWTLDVLDWWHEMDVAGEALTRNVGTQSVTEAVKFGLRTNRCVYTETEPRQNLTRGQEPDGSGFTALAGLKHLVKHGPILLRSRGFQTDAIRFVR